MAAAATATADYKYFNGARKCWSKCMSTRSSEYMYNSVASTKI
jgi:hypothetical protein